MHKKLHTNTHGTGASDVVTVLVAQTGKRAATAYIEKTTHTDKKIYTDKKTYAGRQTHANSSVV